MADATRTVDIIFRGQNQLGAGIDSVESSLGGIEGGASAAEEKVGKLGTQIEALGTKPAVAVNKLGAALTALAGSLILKDFIDANVQFEKFERTMTLLTGSSEQAAQEFEYVTDLANKLGLEVLTTANSYAQLTAATKGTAIEGQQTRNIFEAISVAMANLGRTSAEADGALLAIQQIASKGKVAMEELRGQLGERLPGALRIASEALQIPIEDMDELVKGGVKADEFLGKFAEALKRTFGDVTYVETYTASLNRLKNAVTDVELQIGNAGGFDAIRKVVEAGTLAVVGSITYFQTYGKVIGTVAAAIANLDFSNLGNAIDEILQEGADKTRAARDAFFELNDAAKVVTSGMKDTASASEEVGAALATTNKQMQTIIPVYDEATGKLIGYTDGISDAADVMSYVYEGSVEAAKGIEKIAEAGDKIDLKEKLALIDSQTQVAVASIKAGAEQMSAAFESVNTGIESTGELLGSLFDNLGEADNFREMFQIEDQIKLENERRTKELELQEKLTKATIDELKARQQMMKSGGALITVNGDGLQPHLEAFMWEILEAIQVRVNADGYEMLLGGP